MKKKLNTKGISLVEMLFATLIVSFASILAISAYLRASKSVKDLDQASYAQTVSTSLLNKMSDEMGVIDDEVWISADGSMVAFDVDGQPILICRGNENVSSNDQFARFSGVDYIQIYYLRTNVSEKSIWSLPKKSYMGYVVSDLNFHMVENDEKVCIEIELSLYNSSMNYSYTNSKVVWLHLMDSMKDVKVQSMSGDDFIESFERR